MVTARYSLLTASAQRGRDRRIEYEPLTRAQSKWMNLRGRIILWRAGNQLGKAQPKDALVLTPSGWKRMGDIMVGEEIIGGDGRPARVTSIFEQGVRLVYRVAFADGASTECCDEHLWRVRLDDAEEWHVLRLGDLREALDTGACVVTPTVEGGERQMVSATPSREADCRCIEVDHPDETYVTDDYIVTHNSRGLAKKLVNFVMRRGPYANRRPGPVKILVVSISKEQMEPLHSKIWELLPKDQIADDVEFTPGYGFRGKPPRVTFTAGEGKGSVITFATYAQGSRRVAGGTFDVVACDEPLPERLFGEARARILHGDPGEMWITMTPTPDSPPLDYLREKVEKGEVIEINTELSVENVTLLNEDGTAGRPLLTQEQIDSFAGDLLEAEKDMRLRGGWDIVVKDRMLSNWGPACVGALRIPRGATIGIGIDHGAGQGKQAAALITIEQPFGLAPRVSVLEESVAEGYTTPDQDAEAILAMLARRGWGYDAVDFWIGDRASGMNRYEIRKSNQELMRQLARILGRRVDELKRIEVPYKFSGSVSYGFRMMNAIMGRRDDKGLSHFRVDPKCQKFIKAAEKWRGSTKDPLKDILDAVRYPTEKAVRPDGWFAFKATYA
jgi:hypothetical protein